MFKDINRGEHFSGPPSPPSSPTGLGVTSLGHESQGSSWINVFSLVSWPVSFLQKYLAGRSRNSAIDESVPSWSAADLGQNIVEDERSFWGHLDDLMPLGQNPTPHLSYLHYPRGNTVRMGEASETSSLSWLTTDSLRELGIESSTEIELNIRQKHSTIDVFTTGRGSVSEVFRRPASAQVKLSETTHVLGVKDMAYNGASTQATSSSNWWGGFWESQHNFQSLVSNLAWSKEGPLTGKHCPQSESGTKAAVAKPTELFVQCNDGSESMPRETTGPACHKEELIDNGDVYIVRPESLSSSEGLPLEHQPSISICSHLVSAGAVTACSEVTVLTPDQDNGYSSLEEEHSVNRMYKVKASCEDLEGLTEMKEEESTSGSGGDQKPDEDTSVQQGEGGSTTTGRTEGEEEAADGSDSEEEEAEASAQQSPSGSAAAPSCQNKAIAYIMGSPCSDDSQSDDEFSDDDDGFDSEGSSEFSDTDSLDDDEDDELSDADQQADAERLWNSLCQSRDPYNPINFTARLPTTTPRAIPPAPCSPLASPVASASLPLSSSSSAASPPSPSPLLQRAAEEEVWDDSTSASEVDEAECARLWNSFGGSSDPYSLLNFQAPIQTQETPKACAVPRARGTKPPCRSARRLVSASAAPFPPHREEEEEAAAEEEEEERLDSGFSEGLPITVTGANGPAATTTATTGCVKEKKVRFAEEVEEFFASCGEEEEERHGPWEELARDRCRFLRRCQEVEAVVGPVLEDEHRRRVYRTLLHPLPS